MWKNNYVAHGHYFIAEKQVFYHDSYLAERTVVERLIGLVTFIFLSEKDGDIYQDSVKNLVPIKEIVNRPVIQYINIEVKR